MSEKERSYHPPDSGNASTLPPAAFGSNPSASYGERCVKSGSTEMEALQEKEH
jgi:hypothetical protein